jgi:hypothetical protein
VVQALLSRSEGNNNNQNKDKTGEFHAA